MSEGRSGMQKRRWIPLILLRKLLTAAICSIAFVALFSVHVHIVPSSKDHKFNDKITTVKKSNLYLVLGSIFKWGASIFHGKFRNIL